MELGWVCSVLCKEEDHYQIEEEEGGEKGGSFYDEISVPWELRAALFLLLAVLEPPLFL